MAFQRPSVKQTLREVCRGRYISRYNIRRYNKIEPLQHPA